MQASVCAPVTTSRPTPALASTSSSSVSSKESPYVLCTSGSESSRLSSGTYSHSCEPFSSSASLCCTQTTGTPSDRALLTSVLMLLMTLSRATAPATTPFCTSITTSAALGRSVKVVMTRRYTTDGGPARASGDRTSRPTS